MTQRITLHHADAFRSQEIAGLNALDKALKDGFKIIHSATSNIYAKADGVEGQTDCTDIILYKEDE